MAEPQKPISSACSRCGRNTKHDVIYCHTEDGGEEYHCAIYYMIVQCRGCENTCFRYVFKDYESAYPTSGENWDVPETIETYPKFVEGHRDLDQYFLMPELVRSVYEESLTAIREHARILAGLGLRGTIEAICNDRGISGKNLEVRISRLASQGLISTKDAERLHAIRFLGNDAAHDIKKPSDAQIAVALRIIEHLITTIYLLDAAAAGKLDTIVSDFSEFKKLLLSHLDDFTTGDEFPVAKFIGKDVRRIQGALTQLEAELIKEINVGDFPKLSVGKLGPFGSLPGKLQHFVVS